MVYKFSVYKKYFAGGFGKPGGGQYQPQSDFKNRVIQTMDEDFEIVIM
ncbi:hypothetical protein SAMN05443144_113105 [Fodinibius roseus]|uniref:Uncharacterized protein n=1 Tax=Fodinibius roseus TaxID=1194090 RepID=A0A1M5EMK6_9BACT|nr:hypothetical protein SAMN05443144_113105 [Fodinibius roseus]